MLLYLPDNLEAAAEAGGAADLTILDACAGLGMLAEAVLLGLKALGPSCPAGRVVCHIERDSAAAAALVARMAGSPLDQAPVYDTLRSFDTRPWRGLVDIACAGLPCQPYSLAGKRRGNDDRRSWGRKANGRRPRGPVAEFLRIVRDVLPAVVFLENVPAWVVGGHFRSVGEELCRLGYTIEDPVFLAAGDVGAPHERERVFILAHRAGDGFDRLAKRHGPNGSSESGDGHDAVRCDANVADDECDRRSRDERLPGQNGQPVAAHGGNCLGDAGFCTGRAEHQHQPRTETRRRTTSADNPGLGPAGGSVPVGNTKGARRTSGNGDQFQEAHPEQRCAAGTELSRDRLPLFPPGRGHESNPDHPDWWAWAAVAEMDASLMPRVEPELSVVADGLDFSRADLLRIGGNGVQPVAAAVAFAHLLAAALQRTGGGR